MNVTPSLDFTTLEPTKKSLTAYANMLQKMWRNLALAVNSKILHFDTVPSGNALTGDLAIDDTTGNLYVWYNGSWIPVSSSSKNFWEYTADTGVTSGDPGKGDIAWNNASQIAATALLISDTTQDGLDVTLFLNLIANGDTLIIQTSGDSTNNQVWTVAGTPTNAGTYYSVPVTLSSSGGTGTTGFNNNAKLILAHFSAGGSGPSTPVPYTALGQMNQFTGTWGNFSNYTVFLRISGWSLNSWPSTFRAAFWVWASTATVVNMVLLTTAKGSTTVLSSKVLTVAGSATPTLTAGIAWTDIITGVTLDKDHDYHLACYFSSAVNLAANSGNQVWSGSYIAGNHTADASVPAPTAQANFFLGLVNA